MKTFWDSVAIVIFWLILLPFILAFKLLLGIFRRLQIIDKKIFKK